MKKQDSAAVELLDPVEPSTTRTLPSPVAGCGCGCGCFCPGADQQNNQNSDTAANENTNFIAAFFSGGCAG